MPEIRLFLKTKDLFITVAEDGKSKDSGSHGLFLSGRRKISAPQVSQDADILCEGLPAWPTILLAS